MSYAIDFNSLDEKLFLLQQIALASEKYCEQGMIGSELDIGDEAFDIYWGWIKSIVSNYLIECAIKTGIFQDYLAENQTDVDLAQIDTQARDNLILGIVHEGKFTLTLRESCNKIIHASKTMPSWNEKVVGDIVFKYWSGCFHLYGSRGKKNWHLELNVNSWAKAMSRYHDILSFSEGRIYIGQDW
jgi:hypothetical protein